MDTTSLDSAFRLAETLAHADDELIQYVITRISSRYPNMRIEWDAGAGDTWVMVDCTEDNWAMLNSTIPLLFASPTVADIIELSTDRGVLIAEENIHSRIYSIEPSTVLETLNLRWPSDLPLQR